MFRCSSLPESTLLSTLVLLGPLFVLNHKERPMPTLEDVLRQIRTDTALNSVRRRDLASAVNRMAELLGRSPRDVPASFGEIRSSVLALNPANVGLAARTIQNVKANLTAALRHTGVPSTASQA